MAHWDQIKKGAEEGLEALKEGMAVFVAEAGKQSKIIKKRVELSAVQNSVRKAFIRLGGLIYDLHSRGQGEFQEDAEVKDLLAQIDEHLCPGAGDRTGNRGNETRGRFEEALGENRERPTAAHSPKRPRRALISARSAVKLLEIRDPQSGWRSPRDRPGLFPGHVLGPGE